MRKSTNPSASFWYNCAITWGRLGHPDLAQQFWDKYHAVADSKDTSNV